ncbi:MAG: hypothetical protein M3Y78_15455 [Pseudomonadota bacterium]|nr:hypothetical protein [Pseudomonadota bacterium]
MAKEQAAVAPKAVQKRAPRKGHAPTRDSTGEKGGSSGRRGGAKGQPADIALPFDLKATNVDRFEIGGPARDVILSGTGLDTAGLRAVIVVRQRNGYGEPDAKYYTILIEQPASQDDIYPDEFPISVKIVKALPGPYYFAIQRTIRTTTERDVLELQPISFV